MSQLRTVRSTLQNLLLTISGAVPFNDKASKVCFVDADAQQVQYFWIDFQFVL